MRFPRRRPVFEIESKLPPKELAHKIRAHLKAAKNMRGLALTDRIELSIAGEELRFWSPQLVAQVSTNALGGSHLRARFGPDPYIWTLYLLSYVALTVLAALALCFGFVQLMMNVRPVALYATPLIALLAGLVYGVSYIGQGLSVDQIYLLRETLTRIAEDVPVSEQPSSQLSSGSFEQAPAVGSPLVPNRTLEM